MVYCIRRKKGGCMYRQCILALTILVLLFVLCGGDNNEEPQPLPFSDGFETYSEDEYPSSGGWYELWSGTGAGGTFVTDAVAYGGDKSFMLSGYPNWTRTDGVTIDLTDVNRLTYEVAVMVPFTSSTGAMIGFFVRISSNESRNYNGLTFDSDDDFVYAKGIPAINTGFTWERDTWYMVKVEIDYDDLLMDVWIDGVQVVSDLEAAHQDTSDIFSISTQWMPISGLSVSFFDDIEMYESP
jgi:hypothetical protein